MNKNFDPRISKEMMKGTTELLVLKVLSEKEMHGYEMIKVIEQQSQGSFQLKAGTLYPILHALENNGTIIGKWEQQSGERKRKIYSISDTGISLLKDKKNEWTEYTTIINRVLAGEDVSNEKKPLKTPTEDVVYGY